MKRCFGETLKKLREGRRLTQAGLAKKIFVSDKTISKWEKGKSIPELDLLIALTEVFNVTLDYLLTGKSSKNLGSGCRAIYNKDGFVDHYVGEDGDRLFTRAEVSTIVKSRISRFQQSFAYAYKFSNFTELEDALLIYNQMLHQLKRRIKNSCKEE